MTMVILFPFACDRFGGYHVATFQSMRNRGGGSERSLPLVNKQKGVRGQ